MRGLTLILLTVTLALTGRPAAAAWNSAGGELASTDSNPWWLDNTKDVEYCIAIDADNFGQSLDVARAKIQAALAYWHLQLNPDQQGAHQLYSDLNADDIHIGTQTFHEVACHDGIDLTFQLGTLDAEQLKFIGNPERVVGVAVQTSYDSDAMRGKGFIYISPELGSLRFRPLPDMPAVHQQWYRLGGKALELVLIHELGHVFGLQHRDGVGVMAANFPASVVAGALAPRLLETTNAPDVTYPNTNSESQGVWATSNPLATRTYTSDYPSSNYGGFWLQRYTLLNLDAAGRVEIRPIDYTHANVYASSAGNPSPTLRGTITWSDRKDDDSELYWTPITLYLVNDFRWSTVPGGSLVVRFRAIDQIDLPASYTPVGGAAPCQLLLHFENGMMRVSVIDAGRVIPNILTLTQWQLGAEWD